MTTIDKQQIKIEPRKGEKLTAIAVITAILAPPIGFICALAELIRIHLNKKEQLIHKHDKVCKIISIIAIILSIASSSVLIYWQTNNIAPWQLEEERLHTMEIQDTLQQNLDPLTNMSDQDKNIIGQAMQTAFEQANIDTKALNLSGKELAEWAFGNIEYTLDDFQLNNQEGTASVVAHIKHRDMKTFMATYTAETEKNHPSDITELGTIIKTNMDNTDFITEDATLNLVDNHNGTWSITDESMSSLVKLLFGGIEYQDDEKQEPTND